MLSEDLYKIKAVILGHAVADALGVPVEFCSREELDENPVETMEGEGTYPYPAGTWSDDTSMTLCALDVLADGELDWNEIMLNFARWLTDGKYSSVDMCFDVGGACENAITNFITNGTPAVESGGASECSNGNGSLMRILPFILYTEFVDCDEEPMDIIHKASALTHAHERSKIGCGIYSFVIRRLLKTQKIDSVFEGLRDAEEYYRGFAEFSHYERLFDPDFKKLDRNKIKSSGYVVDTLEAAIWCLLNTSSYKECVLKAVNLGEDTDTVAAVAGGLAGALYGYDAIPSEWLEALIKRDYIEDMCERAHCQWCM